LYYKGIELIIFNMIKLRS